MEKMMESYQFERREGDLRIILTWILVKQVVRMDGLRNWLRIMSNDISDDKPSGYTTAVSVKLVG
jgi:hypothetical protein